MNHRPIFNTDVKWQESPGDLRPALRRLTYLGVAGLALVAALLLWGGDTGPVEARVEATPSGAGGSQLIPLQLPAISSPASNTPVAEKPVAIPDKTPAPRASAAQPETIAPETVTHEALVSETAVAETTLPETTAGSMPGNDWHEVTVKSGDSLAVIFSRLDISPQQLGNLLELGGAVKCLKKIYPGQHIRLQTAGNKDLLALSYPIDKLSSLEVRRVGDEFTASTTHRIPEHLVRTASVEISNSLFLSAQEAGLSDGLIMELAGIFAWDIDFALDIRKGDQFTVLYEEQFLDGENIGGEKILAAEFVNRGKQHHAFRYTDESGESEYYSLNGKSMRKTFLRTPVEFSRISSRFSLGRKHPVLNRIRAHKGVDYAAARGTPVKATANGKIIYRGKKGGYGNTIIVQHGTRYSTLYAHLSKYRSGLKTGSRVKQGQTIGYVGSTGLATGPHLHYEFRVDDVHRDPLRVKLPGAESLDKKYRDDFDVKAQALLAQLKLVQDVQLASR